MAPALRMYWWYAAAANAPTNGPTQKIHCMSIKSHPVLITLIFNFKYTKNQEQHQNIYKL
jgi:hypothetical protein